MINFTELKKQDCTKYVEQKGGFNYLSWPYMVDQLRTLEPSATIHARKNASGLPYFIDESCCMVETYILLDGVEVWNEWLPVMDYKNKAIKNPNSMDINKTIQRCKAKCISEYTGIGLYLYMGEDLPDANTDYNPKKEVIKKTITTDQSNKLVKLVNDLIPNAGVKDYKSAATALGIDSTKTSPAQFDMLWEQANQNNFAEVIKVLELN